MSLKWRSAAPRQLSRLPFRDTKCHRQHSSALACQFSSDSPEPQTRKITTVTGTPSLLYAFRRVRCILQKNLIAHPMAKGEAIVQRCMQEVEHSNNNTTTVRVWQITHVHAIMLLICAQSYGTPTHASVHLRKCTAKHILQPAAAARTCIHNGRLYKHLVQSELH